jgi:hypothetical protein
VRNAGLIEAIAQIGRALKIVSVERARQGISARSGMAPP